MDRSVYVAMTGASQIWEAMSVNTQNLANVSTTGFKASLSTFQSQPVYGPGHASRVYATAQKSGVDLSPGSMVTTGRDLDVAVDGDGLIAVQAPDGQEAYTRAGHLQVTANGRLLTGSGHPVMGNGGPVAISPYEDIEIGADGTISIRPVGQQANALAVVDRIKLANPSSGELEKGPDGLLHLKAGAAAPADASVKLASGMLEESNVNPVDAMVNMVELGRRFEMQVKLMKATEEAEKSSARLMRVSG